jgi:Cu/Ag efflux protein CusF
MHRNKIGLVLVGLVAVLLISGVQFAQAAKPARSPQSGRDDQKSKTQRYVLTGTVQSIDAPNHQIEVDGDAVPGYMDAMSMPYSVPDDKALKALNVGDIIRADIVVEGNDSHLENIKVTGHAKPKAQ